MAAAACPTCGPVEWTDRGTCPTCHGFPSLGYLVAEWMQDMLVVPDRAVAGDPLILSDEQIEHLVWQYRLWPHATYDPNKPAAPFVYNGSVLVRSQKWGKGPFSAARICAQAVGPVLFEGWDANGEPVGIPWATPHIQVAAAAEDQTENIWRVLKPMIDLGPLAEVIPNTGLDDIRLLNGGLIQRVSSNARTRLGARLTYVEIDQPESMNKTNGGDALADVLLRNIAPLGGRWSATGNAHDPTEGSVQQTWIEKPTPDVHIDYPDPLPGSWTNRRERRRILKHAYRGAPWVDVDRIEAECDRLAAKGDPGQAERFYGNRIVAGASKAFDSDRYKELRDLEKRIPAGRKVTAGFDGSKSQDSTGLVVTDIETGHQVVVQEWARPLHLHEDDEWTVPVDEVDEAVDFIFETWDVWRLYGDPPGWVHDMARWAGKYGRERVVEWWTAERKKMAYAIREWVAAVADGNATHGPLSDDPEHVRFHERLEEHVANAVKRRTNIRDEETGQFLWVIAKDGQRSVRKIDLAMCAILAWVARGDAIRAGVLDETQYERASW